MPLRETTERPTDARLLELRGEGVSVEALCERFSLSRRSVTQRLAAAMKAVQPRQKRSKGSGWRGSY